MPAPVFQRKLPLQPLEDPAEVGHVLEPDVPEDVGDGATLPPQQLLGAGDPPSRQVLGEVEAGHALKAAAEIRLAHPRRLRHGGQAEAVIQILIDVPDGL